MDLLISYAMSWVGKPYLWGGDDWYGMDCSGLVQELLQSVGLDPRGDQTAHGLYKWFSYRGQIGYREAGALAFYGSDKRVVHVAFMVDSMRVIEAGGGDSRTKTHEDSIRQNAYVRMRPYDYRSDFFCVILPNYPSHMKKP